MAQNTNNEDEVVRNNQADNSSKSQDSAAGAPHPAPGSINKTCVHWRNGTCKKGAQCAWQHAEIKSKPAAPGQAEPKAEPEPPDTTNTENAQPEEEEQKVNNGASRGRSPAAPRKS